VIYELHKGDSRDILPDLIKKGMQVDSIVTDPPYHLTGKTNKEKGFMGKKWDGGDIAQDPEFWKLCYQILKPGGYLLAFSSTRTYHDMASAIADDGTEFKIVYNLTDDIPEDIKKEIEEEINNNIQLTEEQFLKLPEKYKKYFKSEIKKVRVSPGFEIRDQIGWLYGNGFPKSHNVSKAIDKHLGKDGTIAGTRTHPTLKDKSKIDRQNKQQFHGKNSIKDEWEIIVPESEEAKQWEGWGTALKPAWEPICVARKPLDAGLTVAENVLKYGTGGINIDASRIPSDDIIITKGRGAESAKSKGIYGDSKQQETHQTPGQKMGRFPANIIHDGSEEVMEEFAKYGTLKSGSNCVRSKEGYFGAGDTKHGGLGKEGDVQITYGDSGSAARFFYSAKASAEDRAGSNHAIVKPIALMSHLCKMVTPPKGIVLDPFAGSGTTGQAAVESGFYPILIEKEPEYQNDIETRMKKLESDAFYTVFE